jgi:hypothetical protein
MIRRNLTRRLEELEARTARPAEPMIAQIVYVSPDGSEEDGPRYELSAVPAPAWQRKQVLAIASDIVRYRAPGTGQRVTFQNGGFTAVGAALELPSLDNLLDK